MYTPVDKEMASFKKKKVGWLERKDSRHRRPKGNPYLTWRPLCGRAFYGAKLTATVVCYIVSSQTSSVFTALFAYYSEQMDSSYPHKFGKA